MAGWHAAELDRRVDSFESRALTLFYVTAGFTIMWLLLAVYVPIFRLGGIV
jgi:type II secretory pathway component PulF